MVSSPRPISSVDLCKVMFWNQSVYQISKQQLQTVKDRFQAFLNGETQIVADEAFMNAVQSYYEVFLKSDRVARMVQSGGCSANDSREVFKKHIEKRVRSLPEIDGLSKETVLSSWMAKFDAIYRGEEDPRKQQARMTASAASELILSKEQLYEMFQNILGIKKFEHQLLYNACQALLQAKGNRCNGLAEIYQCKSASQRQKKVSFDFSLALRPWGFATLIVLI
ncbi:Calcium-dependent secretion activator 1 [Microtus ochrogaster]|uniref:Calcium-dependent secretion activator 1 n=1 Tax=Microtus ochrogaster TaxID=79684 RepID=A0A8J6FZV7_MICOH|nr:Calcium-dependent secretion activator 1 [Microtus ochrogaster]